MKASLFAVALLSVPTLGCKTFNQKQGASLKADESIAAASGSLANADAELMAFLRSNMADASASAMRDGYRLSGDPKSCIGERSGETLRGVCMIEGDLNAPNSRTVFSISIAADASNPGAGAKFTARPVTGEDVEPVGGHASGSIEDFLIDGGGEDAIFEQLAAMGIDANNGVFTGSEEMRCLSVDPSAPLGACILTADHSDGSKRRVAVIVSEEDGGNNVKVSVVALTATSSPQSSGAQSDAELKTYLSANMARAAAAAERRGYYLTGEPKSCIGERHGSLLHGVCLIDGDLNAPNSNTVFALSIKVTGTGANPRVSYWAEPITGEDFEPNGGHATGSLETYVVDGGGEDAIVEKLSRIGFNMDDGLFTGSEDLRCMPLAENAPLGACLVSAKKSDGSKRRIAVTVSEKDNGSNLVVSARDLGKIAP